MTPDRIEKQVILPAPLQAVWHAVADAGQFGTWFGVRFDGPFAAGATVTGHIVPTRMDPDIARLQQPYAGTAFALQVDQIVPMRRIAFRWHPFAVEPGIDYTAEPMTLIVFALEPVADGTRLTITESGFDQLPPARRARAYAASDGGWTMQTRLIATYLAGGPSGPKTGQATTGQGTT
ncbi:SRPBCC family protein [Nguyenibacter vanlangensis]|uniref:SRPBCC family protein n=1 Tax=Nguyenibacter vanlangensis TaxID=1216886 RepID=A0A7Y7IYG4_9PROT|nr:SRPBCC family protein [Nguyenibacter vanlangensis]NVN12620.1 SRPBCC family protein [Nguyenibacter vanlangensis]